MVSLLNAIGISLGWVSISHLGSSHKITPQISRNALPPAAPPKEMVNIPKAITAVKEKSIYENEWQKHFWDMYSEFSEAFAEEKIVGDKTFTALTGFSNLIWSSKGDKIKIDLDLKVKGDMTLGQFFLDERGTVIAHYLFDNCLIPIQSLDESFRIALVLGFPDEIGDISLTIERYGIRDEQALLRIGNKILEKEWPSFPGKLFRNKDSYTALVESSTEMYPKQIAKFVSNGRFRLDKKITLKLAKICAQNDIFQYVDLLSQKSEEAWSELDWLEICSIAIRNNPHAFILYPSRAYWQESIEARTIFKLMAVINPELAISTLAKGEFKSVKEEEDILEIYQIALVNQHNENPDMHEELKLLEILFKQVKDYRSPQARTKIIDKLAEFLEPELLKKWASLVRNKDKEATVHTMIPALLTLTCTNASWQFNVFWRGTKFESKADGIAAEFIENIRKQKKHFKFGPYMHLLVNFLIQLNYPPLDSHLDLDQKGRGSLISQVFADKDVSSRLRSISTFLSFGKGRDLVDSKPIKNEVLSEMCQKLLCEAFHLDKEKFGGAAAFEKLYNERVADKFRDKDALMVYAGKINSLESLEREAVQDAYSNFVTALLNNKFYDLRNESPQMIELAKIEGGQALTKFWNNPPPFSSLSNYLGEKGKDETFSKQFKQFLTEKLVTDNHIDNYKLRLPFLDQFLNWDRSPEALLKELSIEKDSPEIQLQICCLELYQSKNKDAKLLENLAEILNVLKANAKTVPIWDQFLSDVTAFSSSKVTQKETLTIGITNDPCDLLLIGRETGGCQNIDGSPETNKSALAYVIDGKNCAIVIKDENGRIKARSIFRILIDEKANKPVLFLERHYSLGMLDSQMGEAINNYAINYAKESGITLLTKETLKNVEGYKEYGPVVSKGSNAPIEYSDAGRGPSDGTFTVPKSYVMYDPTIKLQLDEPKS